MKVILKVLAVFLAGIVLYFSILSRVEPLQECNEAWPQSYSKIPLDLQPCPTPIVLK